MLGYKNKNSLSRLWFLIGFIISVRYRNDQIFSFSPAFLTGAKTFQPSLLKYLMSSIKIFKLSKNKKNMIKDKNGVNICKEDTSAKKLKTYYVYKLIMTIFHLIFFPECV